LCDDRDPNGAHLARLNLDVLKLGRLILLEEADMITGQSEADALGGTVELGIEADGHVLALFQDGERVVDDLKAVGVLPLVELDLLLVDAGRGSARSRDARGRTHSEKWKIRPRESCTTPRTANAAS
jgi:hypothetical protein